MTDIRCKTCEQGVLTLRKVHRMSGPAVTIGYILLIPSLIGIAFAVVFFAASIIGAASVAQERLTPATVQRLHDAQVPDGAIAELQSGKPLPQSEKASLTPDQSAAVSAAESEITSRAGAVGCLGACGTGMAATIGVLSFVGGLLGWLLVMKKRVLACSSCSAVTNAS